MANEAIGNEEPKEPLEKQEGWEIISEIEALPVVKEYQAQVDVSCIQILHGLK